MMDLVCIVCPRGCRISINDGVVSGNSCKKGEAFAIAETTCPMRTVCSTVATTFESMPVLPVRTDGEIPKAQIPQLMKLINSLKIDKKVKMGDVIFENLLGTNVNLIASESVFD